MLLRLIKNIISHPKNTKDLLETNETPKERNINPEYTELNNLLEHAYVIAQNSKLSPSTKQKVDEFTKAFPHIVSQNTCNLFVFHISGIQKSEVNFRDVKLDLSRFDYTELLNTFIRATFLAKPDAQIILVTEKGSTLTKLKEPQVHIVEIPLNPEFPMYERALSMCAYVNSPSFNNNTIFLDSDAFLTKDPTPIFDGGFDIALTFREIPGLMPINEGVIFASHRNQEKVRIFFKNYLATYDTLITDKKVLDYYGNIKQWRGGQLSLNAQVINDSPFSPYKDFSNDQSDSPKIGFLPCDIFNYSFEYGKSLKDTDAEDRYILHLKGVRKEALEHLKYILNIGNNPLDIDHFTTPYFATFNKMYSDPPLSIGNLKKQFLGNLLGAANTIKANQPFSGAFLADDSFTWFRNLGFLTDSRFNKAFEPYSSDQILKARIWRVYTLCWAAQNCLSIPGDFVDIGCYDGKTVDIMSRYSNFPASGKSYFLYDIFDNPPQESRKVLHGPQLSDHVKHLFADRPSFKIIKGILPDSFEQGLPEKIAFAQIDLNAAEPELACLEVLFDRIVSGGMIILDDYGFLRYKESHLKETTFFSERNHFVLEMPTGQGLVIKRN